MIDESIKALLGYFNYCTWEIWNHNQESTARSQRDADACRRRSRLPVRHCWGFSLTDLESAHIDKRLGESFRFLVVIHHILCLSETKIKGILNAYFVAGSRLLQDLERALSNSSLSGCDADTLRALVTIIYFTASVIFLSRPPLLRVSLLHIRVMRQLMKAEVI